MNEEQCHDIMMATCYILDSNPDIEARLKSDGIKKEDLKKIKRAFDLIYEVNQTYSKLKTKVTDGISKENES